MDYTKFIEKLDRERMERLEHQLKAMNRAMPIQAAALILTGAAMILTTLSIFGIAPIPLWLPIGLLGLAVLTSLVAYEVSHRAD